MAEKSATKSKPVVLPMARIKTIMRSSAEITNIGQESVYLVARATELFIQHLATEAFKQDPETTDTLAYGDLAEVVNDADNLQFLADVIPKKIVVRDYLRMVRQQEEEKEKAKQQSLQEEREDTDS
ncbi:CHRAC1 [Branchiostoma lanceolatum]|uniref:Chromatin accessibility complex protein 1 n=2 Tax=Branchiostoma lanceolatum TaxID=7740 RepID=A0A8J9Z6C7_BRALA|nr:CHRAC1 [Branchiostoma lanceolatum]